MGPRARRKSLVSRHLDIRVATYNIHACVGIDRRYDPDRIARVIRDIDADVIALQEVDHRRPRWQELQVLDYLAGTLNMTAIPGPAVHEDAGDYGNAVLTRLPIAASRRIDLSIERREPRSAIELDLHASGADLRVIATHLGLSRAERRHQRRVLAGEIDRAERQGEPVILLADLNEWLPRLVTSDSRPHLPFDLSLSARTYPSLAPFFRLDRILADPAPTRARGWAHRAKPARLGSDHLALVADLSWSLEDLPGSHSPGDLSPSELDP